MEHHVTLEIVNGNNRVRCVCGWSQNQNPEHPEPIIELREAGLAHVQNV